MGRLFLFRMVVRPFERIWQGYCVAVKTQFQNSAAPPPWFPNKCICWFVAMRGQAGDNVLHRKKLHAAERRIPPSIQWKVALFTDVSSAEPVFGSSRHPIRPILAHRASLI